MKHRLHLQIFFILSNFCLLSYSHAYQCESNRLLTKHERLILLNKLRISNAGKLLILNFQKKYKSINNLSIQWDTVSYSQIDPTEFSKISRRIATVEPTICVHLAEDLPEIEHVADLAHELIHATKLDEKVLMGDLETTEAFVRSRISAPGGEAEAFATECLVKREIMGKWDELCSPYVKADAATDSGENIDIELVITNLYNGELSASLTGEPYPFMLARQFEKHMAQKTDHSSSTKKSTLVNP